MKEVLNPRHRALLHALRLSGLLGLGRAAVDFTRLTSRNTTRFVIAPTLVAVARLAWCIASFCAGPLSAAEKDRAVTKSPIWDCERQPARHVFWRANLPGFAGALAVEGDKLLVGGCAGSPEHGSMRCYDAKSGLVLWEARHEKLPERARDMPGLPIHSTPFIEGGRAWYLSNRGELVCVNLEPRPGSTNADIVWSLDLIHELGVNKRGAGDVGNPMPSPLVLGDVVYTVTMHGYSPSRRTRPGNDGRPQPPSFLAVNKRTGKVVWSSNLPGTNILYGQWSSPVHARVNGEDEIIFPGGDGWLYSFEAKSGRLIWQVDGNEPGARDWTRPGFNWQQLQTAKNFFVADPVVHGNVLYVGMNKDFEMPSLAPLLAIRLDGHGDATKESIKWRFQALEFESTYVAVAIASNVLFTVSCEGVLFALDLESGRELWHCDLDDGRSIYAAPVVHDGKVYVAAESRVTVFAVARTKECFGRYELGAAYPHTPVVKNNRLYVGAGQSVWSLWLPDEE